LITNQFGAQKHVELRSDREAIKRTLFARVACSNSYDNSTCAGLSSGEVRIVPLFDRNNSVVVSNSTSNPTRMGSWAVRAECAPSGDGITVRAATLRPEGTLTSTTDSAFIPSPLSGRVDTWSSNHTLLFPEGSILCPDAASDTRVRGIALLDHNSVVPNHEIWPDYITCHRFHSGHDYVILYRLNTIINYHDDATRQVRYRAIDPNTHQLLFNANDGSFVSHTRGGTPCVGVNIRDQQYQGDLHHHP